MPSYRELLAQAKEEIEEVDASRARDLLASDHPAVVDVRERDEWEEGHLPGAVHIPRGHLESRMLLIGAGGLGSPASLYLAAAGVGTLGIVDDDVVDETNLQRQIVHSTERLGEPKAESAKRTIEALNPDVTVELFRERLSSENVDRILGEGWDVIVDGADNFPTRYLLNDASIWHDIPVVHGSIYRFEGQTTVFKPKEGPCYRCLFRSSASCSSSTRRRRRSTRSRCDATRTARCAASTRRLPSTSITSSSAKAEGRWFSDDGAHPARIADGD